MTKIIMYTYLGTNGTICSPVHLEDVYYIRKMKLIADAGKILTKDLGGSATTEEFKQEIIKKLAK